MTIRLDPPRLRELQRLAREAGLRPGQLAQRWVEERLERGDEPAAARTLAGVAATPDTRQLDELRARLDEQAERLEELSGRVSALSSRRETAIPEAPRAAAAGPRRPRLHEEIVEVLREAGGVMSAGEIAQAIRERGRYRAPRSNEQVNGAMVSGRVSNPHYRSLFVREGRRIGLAEQTSTD